MHLQPQNDAFGASMGSMKKADAFFMLVLFYWVECWGVVGPPKRNCRERGWWKISIFPNESSFAIALERYSCKIFHSKYRVRHFANPDFIDSGLYSISSSSNNLYKHYAKSTNGFEMIRHMAEKFFVLHSSIHLQKKGRSQMETPPGKNQFYHHLRTFVQCIT
jgi:hypothetical protein